MSQRRAEREVLMATNNRDMQFPHGHFDYGGKRIRDNVHGDILIPEKFLRVVNTPEFQRLRRIKQLATAQYVFPSADHTRFVHSIGTFAVMQQIISHFERYFYRLGKPELIKEGDKDTLLLASLLHDLGHTPFSHAMEDVLPNAKKIPHEKWTTDIIRNKAGQLNQVICKTFGEEYPDKVADLILRQLEKKKTPFFKAENISLGTIFHSLISSQIDADRLDYIRRDSLATGVSYGLIDIDRLISGFRIGILDNGDAVICIAEKFLPDIEGYLYARYQMYRNIYLKPFKILTEELLRKIVQCVYHLYESDKIRVSDLPPGFKAALQQPAMSIDDYLSLDDYVIMGAIKGWAKLEGSRTKVLSTLCQCLINREGFVRYTFADSSSKAIEAFQNELLTMIKPNIHPSVADSKSNEEWINEFPFVVLKTVTPQLYKANGVNSIYIIENSGRLVELSNCSGLIRASGRNAKDADGQPEISAIYFSKQVLAVYLNQKDIFGHLDDAQKERIMESVETLFDRHRVENTIEIEKKYFVPDSVGLDDKHIEVLKTELENIGYKIEESGQIEQTDRYLDTEDDQLYQAHCSLRIRVKGGKASLTCKRPVVESRSSGSKGQMERYEYIRLLESPDLTHPETLYQRKDSCDFIHERLGDIVAFNDLKESILIQNTRLKFNVCSAEVPSHDMVGERYELAFDSVTYMNLRNGRSHSEKQIELELKSDPITRLNMQLLTEHIESALANMELKVMTNSKYERAKWFTEEPGEENA